MISVQQLTFSYDGSFGNVFDQVTFQMDFIDIFSRMQIEKMLISYQPTLIFVEHDEAFTRAVATKTIVIGE